MCGIAGLFYRSTSRGRPYEVLDAMTDSVAHRGPDERGVYVDGCIALGHRRLSIIDLSAGQQPMVVDGGALALTFNGEVFNYVELRDELRAHGHQFATESDTEVILRAYAEYGVDCVEHLNGDFAFALWDRNRQRLLLARDRMGVRPLYYAFCGGELVFASEVKALLQVPGITAEVDPFALDQCFTFWAPVAPRTIFKGIYELPPGHMLVATEDHVTIRRYWGLTFPDAADDLNPTAADEARLAGELRSLLTDATRIRLRADVPVGAYLSGGLDSSVLALLMAEIRNGGVETFSVTFESGEFDETSSQQATAAALRANHHAILSTQRSIGEDFPDVVRHAERPVIRTAPTPLFQLSRFVRQHGMKVVMTGEGADEVFAGYDIFKEDKLRRFWAKFPDSKLRPQLLRRLYPYLPGIQAQPQAYLEAFFRRGLEDTGNLFYSHLPRWHTTSLAKVFFSGDLQRELRGYDAVEELEATLSAEFRSWHPLNRAQYLEATQLLPGYILSSQGDRVAMAHAVEGRFPFLDHRVVEFGAALPTRLKLRNLREKHLLRRCVEGELPESVTNRPKQPYRAPDAPSFFGPDAPEYVAEMLAAHAISGAGYFDPSAVGRLARKCQSQGAVGFRDSMAVVGVLSTQLLHHSFIDSSVCAAPLALGGLVGV